MPTYGIDLGSTYSCIAHVDATGRPVVVKNAIGDDATPSVVFFETPDNVVVGREAKNSAKISPDLVVSLIKRRMGDEGVELEYHGTTHTPVTVSALILREMARSAEQNTHEKVKDVVITVPAYFGVKAREATRAAGEIAGLNVLNVVPEPVAAALHYGVLNDADDRTVLVYDLGGGTFDTTVIRVHRDEITVVCTDGDHRLGGADWDERIAEMLLRQFMSEHPESDAASSEDFLQELTTASEDVKKSLTAMRSRRYNMRVGDDVTRAEVSREKFEHATADLLERTFTITERTVATARAKGVTRFDEVLLVGGSTRMPAVGEGLQRRFGFTPKLHDPDLAVAKGAALFAVIESFRVAMPPEADGTTAEPSNGVVEAAAAEFGMDPASMQSLLTKKVATVVSRAFGVRTHSEGNPDGDADGFIVDHVLKANTALPATPPMQTYGTLVEGQTAIRIEVWEQAGATESARIADNEKIGEGTIVDLPPLPRNSPIEVRFAMDEMATLRVDAHEPSTGKQLTIELVIGGLTSDELDVARSAVAKYTVGA